MCDRQDSGHESGGIRCTRLVGGWQLASWHKVPSRHKTRNRALVPQEAAR